MVFNGVTKVPMTHAAVKAQTKRQRIGDIGVDQLAHVGKLRTGKHRIAQDPVGNGPPEQIGAEFAPARVRAVGDQAHHRIADGVDHLRHDEHHADQRGIDAEHIGVVIEQEDVEDLEEEVGSRVAQAVAEFFLEGKPLRGIVFGLVVLGHQFDSR
jgi:hypothetical protein